MLPPRNACWAVPGPHQHSDRTDYTLGLAVAVWTACTPSHRILVFSVGLSSVHHTCNTSIPTGTADKRKRTKRTIPEDGPSRTKNTSIQND